jgi:hypothetical protein
MAELSRKGSLATARRHSADFLSERAAKGGITVLALYGSAFLRHTQVERWRRDKP